MNSFVSYSNNQQVAPSSDTVTADMNNYTASATGIPIYPTLSERRENERRILHENKHHFRTSDAPFTPRFVGKTPSVRFHSHDAPFSVMEHLPKSTRGEYHSSDAPFDRRVGRVRKSGGALEDFPIVSDKSAEYKPIGGDEARGGALGDLPPPPPPPAPEEKKEEKQKWMIDEDMNPQDKARTFDPKKSHFANPNQQPRMVSSMSMPSIMTQFFPSSAAIAMKHYKKKGRMGRRIGSLRDQSRKWISRGFGDEETVC